MPDDGAVSAGRATGVAAAIDEDGFDFAPLMAEGERLVWQGRSRPLWREFLHGSLKRVFWMRVLLFALVGMAGCALTVQGLLMEDEVFSLYGPILLFILLLKSLSLGRSIRMQDRVRYAVTNRQLLFEHDGTSAQLPLMRVKQMIVLAEADGSGTVLFDLENNLPSTRPSNQIEMWALREFRFPVLKESRSHHLPIFHFAVIDDVWAVHDLIERERAMAG